MRLHGATQSSLNFLAPTVQSTVAVVLKYEIDKLLRPLGTEIDYLLRPDVAEILISS